MTYDEYLAIGRHLVSYGAGIATVVSVTAVAGVPVTDVQSGLDHIINGMQEIGVGISILAPIGMAAWAKMRSSPSAKIADVAAMPDVKEVIIEPNATPELKAVAANAAVPKVVAG